MVVYKQNFQKILSILLVVGFIFTPTHVAVNAITRDSIKKVEEDAVIIEKYFVVNEDGDVIYNRDIAIDDGIDLDLLDLADNVYAYAKSQTREAEKITVMGSRKSVAEVNAKALAFPVYGNWCGPNYGSGTPIDLLDKGCKNHDICYRDKGRHKCSCDQACLSYINRNYNKMTGGTQKAMAKIIKTWLQIKVNNITATGGNFSCRK